MICCWREHFQVQTPMYHHRVHLIPFGPLTFAAFLYCCFIVSDSSSGIVTKSLWRTGSTAVPFVSTDFLMMCWSHFISFSASWALLCSCFILSSCWVAVRYWLLLKLLTFLSFWALQQVERAWRWVRYFLQEEHFPPCTSTSHEVVRTVWA